MANCEVIFLTPSLLGFEQFSGMAAYFMAIFDVSPSLLSLLDGLCSTREPTCALAARLASVAVCVNQVMASVTVVVNQLGLLYRVR